MNIKPFFRKQLLGFAVIGLLGFGGLMTTPVVQSHSDPLNCSATAVGMSVSVYRADGITPVGSSSVTTGETIVYRATLSHLGTPNCNYEGGILTITKPDGVVVNVTGSAIPLVTLSAPFVSLPVNYVVQLADVGNDNDLDASASYSNGTSHMGANNVSPIGASIVVASNFDQHRPFVVTQIHNGSHTDISGQTVLVGTQIHDQIILTPSSPSFAVATGTVDFLFYNNATCVGTPVSTENNVLLTNGIAESATTTAALNAISYRVHYDGDFHYPAMTADCEWLLVNQTLPFITTEIHTASHANVTDGSIVVGTPVHDKVILTASSTATSTPPMATGTVNFEVFNNATCIGHPMWNQLAVPLVNGMAESVDHNAGVWWMSYRVHYNGDANYPAVTADCEVVKVTRPDNRTNVNAVTEIHTANHLALAGTTVPVGTPIHDNVMVTPIATSTVPMGSVTFTMYSNGTCYGTPLYVQNDIALVNGTAESATRTPAVGQYSYRAVYNGDNLFNDKKAVCEPFTVTSLTVEPATIQPPVIQPQPRTKNPTEVIQALLSRFRGR